jgi:hypothetical protein
VLPSDAAYRILHDMSLVYKRIFNVHASNIRDFEIRVFVLEAKHSAVNTERGVQWIFGH